jgi:hypothetical protein
MSIAEKSFLGSLMKAEYLLKDTVIRPEQLALIRLFNNVFLDDGYKKQW